MGRYLIVQTNRSDVLNFCEVQVFGGKSKHCTFRYRKKMFKMLRFFLILGICNTACQPILCQRHINFHLILHRIKRMVDIVSEAFRYNGRQWML